MRLGGLNLYYFRTFRPISKRVNAANPQLTGTVVAAHLSSEQSRLAICAL